MWNKKNIPNIVGLRKCYQNIFWMFKIVIQYVPLYFVVFCLFQIFCAIQIFFEFTYTLKMLLDFIQNGAEYVDAVEYMIFMLVLVIIKLIWAAWMENFYTPKIQEILHRKLRIKLYKKAVGLDLEKYDEPEFYNEFVWSISEATTRVDLILQDFGSLLYQIVSIVVNSIFFVSIDAFGIVFVALSLILTLIMNSYIGRLQFARDRELKPIERKRNYFNRIFYLNDYAKEIRLNPVADQLKQAFLQTNSQVYPIVKKYGKKNAIAGLIGDFGANDVLMNGLYLGYLMFQTVVNETLSYGSTMALFNASSSLKNTLKNLALTIPKFEQHGLYVEKIRTFLSSESKVLDGEYDEPETKFEELTFNNVSFAYEKNDDILHDININIKAGEKIAIVGYNGAGKTTLIKLLLRLYDVKNGEILLNGRNIKEYKKNYYRNLFANVFQDYKIFATSIANNVAMRVTDKEEKIKIEDSLIKSGFGKQLESLPNGIATLLTREFDEDGVNLSGGEAQKVAIARTFFKNSEIIILDEPSSALDPVSEYQLNKAMLEVAKDKTVIFISHRLSSTVDVDRVYMLEKGRIIEQGSHANLIKLNGKYAQMFKLQAEKYNL